MKKQIIWIVIAMLIIVAATLGILYYTTDLFKTPEQLFYSAMSDGINLVNQSNFDTTVEAMMQEAEVSGEITAKITADDGSMDEFSQTLERGKIIYNTKTVAKDEKVQCDITLNYDNKDVVTLNVLKDKEQYALKISDVYEKYIAVENNNLKAIFQKLGMDSTEIPDRIEMPNLNEILSIDEETANYILKTYSEAIKGNIPLECYSIEKEVDTTIENETLLANAYRMALTEKQLINVTTKFLETLKADDRTLDLYVERYNKLVEAYETTLEETVTITKQGIIEEIDIMLEKLSTTEGKDNIAYEMSIYRTNTDKAKIEVISKELEEIVAKSVIELVNDESTSRIDVTFENEEDLVKLKTSLNEKNADVTAIIDSEGLMFQLDMKEEVKSTRNVQIDELTEANSDKLNDMTTDQMTSLIQKIYTNLTKILPTKAQMLGIQM